MLQQEALTWQIWLGMLDSERAVRYCDKLNNKMKFRHKAIGTLLTGIACGAIAPVLAPIPQYYIGIALAAVAFLSVWFMVTDYSGKAAASRVIGDQYKDLVIEWKALWGRNATQDEITVLQRRFDQIDKGGDLGEHHSLNEEAMDEAENILWSQLGGK